MNDSDDEQTDSGSDQLAVNHGDGVVPRRSFLLAGVGWLGSLIENALSGKMSAALGPALAWVHAGIQEKYLSRAAAKGAAQLEEAVFPFDSDVIYCAGAIHAERFREVPVSMQIGAGGLLVRAGVDKQTFRSARAVAVPSALAGNVVTFGSPSSNEIAAAVFGHRPLNRGAGTALMGREPNHPLELPVQFELVGEQVEARMVTRGLYDEPNWGLRVCGQPVFPKVDNSGRLREDFCVLSKLPNVLARNSRYNGNGLFVVAGLHGPGTQGLHNVLVNPRAVDKINRLVRSIHEPYWQVVVPITGVRRDARTGRDLAVAISVDGISLYPVRIDDKAARAIELYDWHARRMSAALAG